MKEFIDKLIERLKEEKSKGYYDSNSVIGEKNCWNRSIEIVNELAEEYKGKKVNSDLISRSEVIKALNEIYLDYPWDSKEDILEKTIGIVEHINCSTDTSTDCSTNNGWIACSERLPEENGWYLVTNELGVVQQQWWGANHWQKLRDEAVIAWQPLPEPYKPKEQPDSISAAWKQQTMSRFERVE